MTPPTYRLSFEGRPQSEDGPPAKQCMTRTLTTANARAVHGYSQTVTVLVVLLTSVSSFQVVPE